MEYGKKKKMMYGGMAKKKMYGGGMTKKKKMAQGGTTARQDQLNERGVFGDPEAYGALNPTQQKMQKEVDNLIGDLMIQDGKPSNPKHSAADVKRIKKEIKDKLAGLDAGFKSYARDRLKFRQSTTGGKKSANFKDVDADKLKAGGSVKKKMKDGGMARKKMEMPTPAGGKMKPAKPGSGTGKMKPVDREKNPGLAKLPKGVRNRMGFMKKGGSTKKAVTEGMKRAGKKAGELGAAIAKVKKKQGMKKGGMAKKKMMGGGMAMKYKHGGKTGKCPRDGIAMRGKTRAGR